MEKLVSILTPCFNGEDFIDRYVSSLIKQNYCNCQLIFMDDGSTDNTKKKILGYESLLKEHGIVLEYHYHENKGVGATISEGLKYVNGDYLIWPDVDDELLDNSIIDKLNFLEKNPQYGIVRTNFIRSLDSLDNVYDYNGCSRYKNKRKKHLFNDYLVSKNMWLQPGCYMIRMSAFLEANPDRYIYETRTGQAWQMLLPLLWKFKCGYIDKVLFNYLVRSNSLSNTARKNYESRSAELDKYVELITATLDHMKINRVEYYKNKVNIYYLKQHISVCLQYSKSDEAKYFYSAIPFFKRDIKTRIKYFLVKHPKVKALVLEKRS